MKIKVLCAAFAAVLLLAACAPASVPGSSLSASGQSISAPSAAASSAASSGSASSAPAETVTEDFSALPEDLQAAFADARTLYDLFYLRAPQHDKNAAVTINGQTYYPITDPHFSSYEEFVNALYRSFTPDYVDSVLLEEGLYESIEGKLYTSVLDRTPNVTFRRAEIATLQPTENELGFTVAAHYQDADLPAGQQDTVKSFGFHAVKGETGWQFDQFAIYR